MITLARDMRPGAVYRRTIDPEGFWYERPPAGTARRLVRRLRPRRFRLNTCDRLALTAAEADLDGRGVLVTRRQRGTDPLTRERFELANYTALPPDYKLRQVRRKPGFEKR